MSDALFTVSSPTGSLTDVAEQLVKHSDLSDPGDLVLGTMIVQLARTIDAAGSRGRASAAAMAARELREAIADLRERQVDPAGSPEDEFAHFRDYMVELVESSGDAS